MRSCASRFLAIAVAAGCLGAAAPALADATCKYIDAEGRITFANVPIKDARRVLCFDPVPERTKAPKQGVHAPSRRASPDSAANVKVDPDTQRRRDLDRRRILEEELTDERGLLDQANRKLSDARQDPSAQLTERLPALLEAVARHGKNIEAIQRELANVR